MGQAQTTGDVAILRRLLRYGDKVCGLAKAIGHICDDRVRPRITTHLVARSVLVMFLTRMGSLNALEQTRTGAFWRRWLGKKLPSADSLGRIMNGVDADSIRQAQEFLYARLKRNKALRPTTHGLTALAIDGHESHATYRRCCDGCLERRIKTRQGWRTQYYHRHVTAMLLGEQFPIWIDAEPLKPNDDELAAARRLLARVLDNYPRAFDLVLGDALYSDVKTYTLLVDRGKDVVTVLKANQPDLLQEAKTLLETVEPEESEQGGLWRETRDLGGFRMAGLDRDLRVVRSRESRHVRRQIDGQSEDVFSEWLWVTTCSSHRVPTDALVKPGHARWDIENRGFNEAVNRWHADHVYKHAANACLTFWLMAMLAFNLFHAFYHRDLKPELRQRSSYQHIARSMASELYDVAPPPEARPP